MNIRFCMCSYYYFNVDSSPCSGIELDGSIVGLAFMGTMCSSRASTALVYGGGRSLESVASTAAHEMGHNFNMNHDGKYY